MEGEKSQWEKKTVWVVGLWGLVGSGWLRLKWIFWMIDIYYQLLFGGPSFRMGCWNCSSLPPLFRWKQKNIGAWKLVAWSRATEPQEGNSASKPDLRKTRDPQTQRFGKVTPPTLRDEVWALNHLGLDDNFYVATLSILTPQNWQDIEDPTPAIEVQTLPLEGPMILREGKKLNDKWEHDDISDGTHTRSSDFHKKIARSQKLTLQRESSLNVHVIVHEWLNGFPLGLLHLIWKFDLSSLPWTNSPKRNRPKIINGPVTIHPL